MIMKSISAALLVSGTLLSAASASALTVNETADFSQYTNRADFVGVLDQGVNTINGSLFTNCVAAAGDYADCSSGDTVDNFRWALPGENFKIVKATATITNFTTSGTLRSENLGIGIGRDIADTNDTNTIRVFWDETFPNLILSGSNSYSFALASATLFDDSTGKTTQGIGEFGFDYKLTLEVAPSPVPVPAAAWLFGSAVMGLACFRRKNKRVA